MFEKVQDLRHRKNVSAAIVGSSLAVFAAMLVVGIIGSSHQSCLAPGTSCISVHDPNFALIGAGGIIGISGLTVGTLFALSGVRVVDILNEWNARHVDEPLMMMGNFR